MADNSKIRTLDDLVQYGATSDFSISKCIQLARFENIVIPEDVVYSKYHNIIKDHIQIMELNIPEQKEYLYRPDRFAMDIYGNTNLSHLILYINGCSEAEFKPERVKYLDPDALGKILKIILTHESSRMNNAKKKALG